MLQASKEMFQTAQKIMKQNTQTQKPIQQIKQTKKTINVLLRS